MNEHELSEGLRAAVADVSAHPDLAEIELGAGRVRARRRVATGVVAAMLVAGAGGAGFGIGRTVSDDGDGGLAAAPSVDTTDPGDDAGDSDDSADGADESGAPGTAAGDTVPPPIPAVDVLADESAKPADVVAPGSPLSSYYEPGPMEVVYERVLSDGVRVRVQRGESWLIDESMGEMWQPAPFCFGSAEMRITLDGPDLVDLTGGSFYDELLGDVRFDLTGAGWSDGRPMRIVTVQAAPAITEATVRWADGPTDTAPLVDGLAVLVVDGRTTFETDYALEVTGATGTRTLGPADLDPFSDPEWRAACQEPPPALPDPGEQPADPVADRAAIVERFAQLWTDVRQGEQSDVLDDWTGVGDALQRVDEGGLADVAVAATQTIEELVFVSPTEAWFRYAIASDLSYLDQRYGTAALVDGVWQFPRAVVCQDLDLAGGDCAPWVEQILPPSWYERYGEPATECFLTEGGEICVDGPVPPPIPVPEPPPEG